MSDLATYVDGSCRLTRVEQLAEFDPLTLEQMGFSRDFGYSNWHYFLRRGRTWQTDAYPSPGAFIKKYTRQGRAVMQGAPPYGDGWPFANYFETNPPG